MGQATLDEDELFDEAATEMRDDVEDALDSVRSVLPTGASIWDVDANNTLGVLNTLKDASDIEDAHAHLRDAKKWYTVGEQADAFDDASDLVEEIETIEETLDHLEDLNEQVTELTAVVPQLRTSLSDIESEDAETEDGSDEDDSDED